MAETSVQLFDVAFRIVTGASRSLIALDLSQGGRPASDLNAVFFLEPKEDLSSEEATLMAEFLTRYIARFGLIVEDAP